MLCPRGGWNGAREWCLAAAGAWAIGFAFSMAGPPPGGNDMGLEAMRFPFFKRRTGGLPPPIRDMVVYGVHCTAGNAMLEKSLFYYCCGKDPTPIIAFGGRHPLYVYADLVDYGNGDFGRETGELYARLGRHGFDKAASEELHPSGLPGVQRAGLTEWRAKGERPFCLLYLQGDAAKVYRAVYNDGRGGTIRPQCICNFRYEMFGDNPMTEVEREVESVMGHCHDKAFQKVGAYRYWGDWGGDEEVGLYRRR